VNIAVNRRSPGTGIVLRVAGLFGTLLVLAITTLLTAWLYGLPFFDLPGAKQIHLADARQALELSADSRSTQIESALRERRGNLRLLSESPVLVQALATPLTQAASAAASRHFQSVMGAYPDVFEYLALVSTGDGRVLAASDASMAGRPLADAGLLGRLSTPGVVEQIETTGPTVAGEPSLIIARQVIERNAAATSTGKLLGVLVASVSIQELLGHFDRVELRSLGDSGSVSLFDQQRRRLATFRLLAGAGEMPPPPASQEMDGSFVENAANGRLTLATYRFVRIAANEGWSLVLRRERDEILHELEQRAGQLLLFGLLFTVCSLIVVALAARHVTRPIRELANVAQRLAEGELNARVKLAKPHHGDEVTTLAAAFNSMAARFETWHATLASEVATRTRELIDQQLQLEGLVEKRTADLRAALAAATQADRAKDAFLANVSHELRTPLNAVIGLAGLARQLSRDPRQQDYLDKIGSAGKSLAHLINDLLDLTKIVAGRLEFENTTFSLRGMFERSKSVLMHQAAEKGLTLVERIDAEVPDTADRRPAANRTDPAQPARQRHQVHQQRPHRAADQRPAQRSDASAPGHRCRGYRSRPQRAGNRAIVPAFWAGRCQHDAQVRRQRPGTRHLQAARREDGWRHLRQQPARCRQHLSRHALAGTGGIAKVRHGPHRRRCSHCRKRITNARVLVVDDHPLNREIVEALLGAVGITPVMASNGQEAVDRLRMSDASAFDLVLMDIQMPVMDGYSATRELRSRAGFEALPIIAMTAHIMEHEKGLQRAAGMSDFIGKPFDHPTFYRTLAKWIPVHKQRQAATAMDALPPATGSQGMPAWPALGAIDSAAGLARFAGNAARYRHWLRDLADQGGSEVRKIEQAMATGQREQACQLAHALAGRVGMLGITSAQAFALQVEAAASRGEAADAAIIHLAAAVDEASEQIRQALGSDAADGTPLADLAAPPPAGPPPASILALLRLLETADGDSERAIHDCLAELGETAWSATLRATLARVRNFDFDAARRLFPDHETASNPDGTS
jgi:CheY-like chemotaxis protein/signal transduction histidine kinase/HPt (histidine-containing phosphotransfer) domain-containing protein